MPRVRLRMLSVALTTGMAVAPALLFGAPHAGAATVKPAAANCTNVAVISTGATPVAASISGAGEVDCFTFSAKTHDHLRVRLITTSGALVASSAVYSPQGARLCRPSTAVDRTCDVKNKGTQTVAIQDASGTNTGGYTVSVQILQRPVGCSVLAFGSPSNSGTISVPGAADCYTFKAAAGARVITRIVATGGSLSPTVEVVNKKGTTVCGPDATLEQNCRVASAGNETIFVRDATGPNPGSYALYVQMNRTATCATIKLGTATQATITSAGQTDCYKFTGTSGDHMRVTVAGTSGTLVTDTEVVQPNGTRLCETASGPEQNCRVTAAGAHTVFVSAANGTKTGDYTIYVQDLNAPKNCVPIQYGKHNDTHPASIGFPGAENCYSFSGTAGTGAHLKVTSTGGPWTPEFEIIQPNGTDPNPGYCDINATDERCVLGVTGTHIILVRDAAARNTGTYDYSLTERTFD